MLNYLKLEEHEYSGSGVDSIICISNKFFQKRTMRHLSKEGKVER